MTCKYLIIEAGKNMEANGTTAVLQPEGLDQTIITPQSPQETEKNYGEGNGKSDIPHEIKRPRGYWKEFENVRRGLQPFIERLGRMPTREELYKAGETSLSVVIMRFGGYRQVARLLGVYTARESKIVIGKKKSRGSSEKRDHKPNYRPPGYWNIFTNVEQELRAFAGEHELSGRMPTPSELCEAGMTGLAKAIYRHGGYEFLAFWLGWRFDRRRRGSKLVV